MHRRLSIALPLWLAITGPLSAQTGKSDKRGRPVSSGVKARERASDQGKARAEHEPKVPPTLVLESVDLSAARAVVRVGGAPKPPDARLFVFHDDRERHFIALYAACDEAGGEKVAEDAAAAPSTVSGEPALRCELDLPRPYLRARVLSMTVRLRGRDVAADEAVVRDLFAAARATAQLTSTTPAVPMTSVLVPVEDPGFDWPPQFPPQPPVQKTPRGAEVEEPDGQRFEDPGLE